MKKLSLPERHDWKLYTHLAVRFGLVLCQKDSFRYAFAFGKANGQSKTALNRAISPPMYRLEKFGGRALWLGYLSVKARPSIFS